MTQPELSTFLFHNPFLIGSLNNIFLRQVVDEPPNLRTHFSIMRISSFRVAFTLKRNFHISRVLASNSNYIRHPNHSMNPSTIPLEFLPPINRAMRQLDKSFFTKTVNVSAATVFDPKDISPLRKTLESTGEKLSLAPIKSIVPSPEIPGAKCVLLNPDVSATDREKWSNPLREMVDQRKVNVHAYELKLSYEDWSMRTILEAVLPEMPPDETETPAGFAIVGHVAHLNLRSQYLPYKNLIGQIVLDRNPNITTVINKLDSVGSEDEFRTFPYEVLAGPDDLDVHLIATDCEFKFNFGKVYWNTRLGTEHLRMIDRFKPGEAVCDVMAGVGPFAVPAGKRKVFVWANDLNPESYKALEWAINKNQVQAYVRSFNKDGRDFIRWATATLPASRRIVTKHGGKLEKSLDHRLLVGLSEHLKVDSPTTWNEPATFDHYVMNLPRTAVEFLDAFRGIYQDKEALFQPQTERKLPMVHVYLFTDRQGSSNNQNEAEEIEVCNTVSQHLGHKLTPQTPDIELLYVRLVSPQKKYYRASFRLPPEVAFAQAGTS